MPGKLHVVCPQCDTTNRVASERLHDGAKCGQCKAPLFAVYAMARRGRPAVAVRAVRSRRGPLVATRPNHIWLIDFTRVGGLFRSVRVGALIDAVFVDPERNRDFYLLYLDLVEHSARDPSFSELSALTERIVNGLYAEVIRDGVQRGTLDVDDVDAAAAAMRAHIEGTFLTWLQQAGNVSRHEMYRTFNCGVGMVIALPEAEVEAAIALLTAAGEKAWKIGKLTASSDEQQVVIN